MRSDKKNKKVVYKKRRVKKQKKAGASHKWVIFVIILLIIAGVGYYGFTKVYGFLNDQLDKLDHRDVSVSNLDIDPQVEKDLSDYTNIAIFGIDTREGEDNETTRTDAIIIASINNKTKDVVLTSVHRDSYFLIDEKGTQVLDKTNHAHAYGGPEGAIKALNRNMDLNIKDFVRVNWQTVADTVDAMGGIELPIKEYEIDELNKYIVDTNESLHGDDTLITEAGTQTLNGVQAVTYCRIRHVGEGDVERAERMRRTLEVILTKMKTMKVNELLEVSDKILPEITTSISNDQSIGLLKDVASYKIETGGTFPYLSDGFYYNGVWYEPAVTLESNVIELHNKVFKQEPYVPTDRVLEISKSVEDITGYNGETYNIYHEGE